MKKILLIEDNKDVRENLADLLELEDYQVMSAEHGQQGIQKAKEFKPDLILCDIMMPEVDGYGVLQALSQEEATAGIPFIFLSAKSESSDIRLGMNLGADDYLTKPVEEEQLLKAISSRLRKSELLQKTITGTFKGLNSFLQEASDHLDLADLSRDHTIKNYPKKEMVYWEGDLAHALYFIESGSVKTYKGTEAGKEFVTGIYGPGDFIGQLSLLSKNGRYIENAVVLEPAGISTIPKEDFLKLLYGSPLVSQQFIGMISNNLIDVQQKLVAMAFAPVRQRAARALLELYDKGIVRDRPNGGMGVPREDFAGLIGTATETAIRTLSEFKDEGLITTEKGRRIILLNKEELEEISEFG